MSSCLQLWRESRQLSRSLNVNTFKNESWNESWNRVCFSRTGWKNFGVRRADGSGDRSYGHRHISSIFVESQLWYNTKLPTIREIRNTVEVPQVRFIDKDAVDVPVGLQQQVLVESRGPTCPLHRKDQRSDNRVDPPSTNHLCSTEDGEDFFAHSILID